MINNNTGENVEVPCWECLFWDVKTGKCGVNKNCSLYSEDDPYGIARHDLEVSGWRQE